jgi:uncharacterized membrane protein
LNIPTLCILFGELIFVSIPGNVFWPYFAGIAILAIGIFTDSKEALRAHGTDKIVTLGPLFFALPMTVFASQHFTEAKAVATLVPSWIPGHLFWTYFVGTALVSASLSIIVKKQARLAAILLAVMLILFELLLHAPMIMAHPRNVIAWAFALRDLAFIGGAMAFAGTQTEKRKAEGTNSLVTLARVFLSVSAIFFGAEHFLHLEFTPGVDFDRSMPTWIPGRVLWAYLAGTVFLIAGTSLIVNRRTRFAATCLGIMALLLILFVYLPILAATPFDIDNGLNFFVSTLAFSRAALLLAKAMPRDGGINSIRRVSSAPRGSDSMNETLPRCQHQTAISGEVDVFYLYVILDVFSRYVTGAMVAMRESAELAKRLIEESCARQNIQRGQLTLHAAAGLRCAPNQWPSCWPTWGSRKRTAGCTSPTTIRIPKASFAT